MRFYQGTHKFYAGVDLHTKTMYVCVLDQDGQTLVHRNIKAHPDPLLHMRRRQPPLRIASTRVYPLRRRWSRARLKWEMSANALMNLRM